MKKKCICLLLTMVLVLSMLPAPASAAEMTAREAYQQTGDYLEEQCQLYTPTVNSIGGEWAVLGLARSGRDVPAGYYDNVVTYTNENINEYERLHKNKSTDNSRVILALTAAGYDVTDVDGHNLLAGLADMTYVKKQGINGPIWALIAFDSHDYEIPTNTGTGDQVTRDALIEYILSVQLEDGGWTLSGDTADSDMTGMAVQALAPYYTTDSDVKTALDKAITCMSELQNADGGYSTAGDPTSESIAQIIVALVALGIDPDTDSRFIKNGTSALDALCTYAVDGGGFEHTAGEGLDGMATEQGYYALTAYFRFIEGENFLYDMSDVSINYCLNGHTEVTDPGKDATCTETGLTEGKHCSVCGAVIVKQETIPTTDHSWDSGTVTKEPTEESTGVRTYTCTVCGQTKTESIPELDHVHSYTQTVTQPTCTDRGYTTYTCACGDTYISDEVPAAGHTEVIDSGKDATCIETGLTEGKHCSVCGTVTVKQETIPARGHSYHNGVCDVCGEADPDYTEPVPTEPIPTDPEPTEPNEPEELPEMNFTDVKKEHWFYRHVEYAYQHSLMVGVNQTQFAPNATTTRAMVVTILYRLEGKPEVSVSNPFTDVPGKSWYTEAIIWAAGNEIVSGYGNGKFGPNDPITREQMAVILHRYAAFKGGDVSVSGDLNKFADHGKISRYAVSAMSWAVGEKIFSGNGKGLLCPRDTATRAEIATILHNYLEN